MTLPCLYLPPIEWFMRALSGENAHFPEEKPLMLTLEACENFPKQTLRNRCYIDSPNGQIALTIPIDKTNFSPLGKCLMRDVKISRQFDWQHQHWVAFASSYSGSPFFDYLQDDFRPIYEKQWTYLMDLNEALLEACFNLLDIPITIERSTSFMGESTETHPTLCPYYQVFEQKHGFIPNLSIIDLLFNMGNEAPLYLWK